MKVIIAGSRSITELRTVAIALSRSGFAPELTEVVSGGARGVDQLGERLARGLPAPCKRFPADWETHGRSAGIKRNLQMAEYADALVAVWDGESRGTKHMIETMQKLGKPVYVHHIEGAKE